MVTNNAWNSQDPAQVAKGGTGLSTITDGSVMVGSGTDAVTPITVGTQGEVLVGTGGDPDFSTTVAGNGNFTFTTSSTGSFKNLIIDNTDTATSGSNVAVIVSNGGTSSGALWYGLDKGTDRSWALGMSNVTNEDLVIHTRNSAGVAPTTGTEVWKMTTAGERTMPLQPAFLANANQQNNVTGDNTLYTITFTGVERFDQGGDFDGTSTFTSPVTGKYHLIINLRIDQLTSSHTTGTLYMVTSNATYQVLQGNFYNMSTISVSLIQNGSLICDMDAMDTAIIHLQIAGGTKVVDVTAQSWFAGYLSC